MTDRIRGMRLLVVGMHNSPHLHRWVRMVERADLSILLFPVLAFEAPLPEGFRTIGLEEAGSDLPPGVWVVRPSEVRGTEAEAADREWGYEPLTHHFVEPELLASADGLARCIDRFRPDLLHGMETQIAGYLCAETARRIGPAFPRWIQSTWGSDLALYGRMPGHAARLRAVFRRVDVHLADCARDRVLARTYGYTGPDMPIIPSSGGVDIDELSVLARVPPSQRRTIIVKGYHNWAGRNLLALSALALAADRIAGYDIEVTAAAPVLQDWAQAIGRRTGLRVRASGYLSHRDALARLAAARMVIGLSISDGLSTTVLEAMAVGTFPIQSRAGCSGAWFGDGRGGLVVSTNDTRGVAEAILRAATDDALVDRAAERNLEIVRRRWSRSSNAVLAWRIYAEALSGSPSAPPSRVGP